MEKKTVQLELHKGGGCVSGVQRQQLNFIFCFYQVMGLRDRHLIFTNQPTNLVVLSLLQISDNFQICYFKGSTVWGSVYKMSFQCWLSKACALYNHSACTCFLCNPPLTPCPWNAYQMPVEMKSYKEVGIISNQAVTVLWCGIQED